KIWVNSELHKGSAFHCVVQLEKLADDFNFEHSNETDSADVESRIKALKGAKILLVEDNEINQELACELLSINGIEVQTADNGFEACEILKEKQFDGVLMDCQMPVMDGFEATLCIRKQVKYKNLPIIALTANVMKHDIEKVLSVGMNDHIAKPINPDNMLLTLSKWVKRDA
ncbi:MAG: response regulator, partial [Gammaproteobacteria bacterium]|nr:response regulator [Gammaproteobacteria bacterium]